MADLITVTYFNGYPPATPDAPLDRFAHDDCLPADQFTVTMLDDFTTGRTDPATGYRVYGKFPFRHQNWPWHWAPAWGAPEPCSYCGRPVKLGMIIMSAYTDNPNLTGDYVWITADDTRGRRSRAAHIGHERRRYAEVHGVTLELLAKSYDEAPGFLHRSSFRYRIIRPAATPVKVTYRDKPAGAYDHDAVPGFCPVTWGDLKPATRPGE